jgi:hypothetical protein
MTTNNMTAYDEEAVANFNVLSEDALILRIRVNPPYRRSVCKVRGLAAVRHCYAEGGGDCYAKL